MHRVVRFMCRGRSSGAEPVLTPGRKNPPTLWFCTRCSNRWQLPTSARHWFYITICALHSRESPGVFAVWRQERFNVYARGIGRTGVHDVYLEQCLCNQNSKPNALNSALTWDVHVKISCRARRAFDVDGHANAPELERCRLNTLKWKPCVTLQGWKSWASNSDGVIAVV